MPKTRTLFETRPLSGIASHSDPVTALRNMQLSTELTETPFGRAVSVSSPWGICALEPLGDLDAETVRSALADAWQISLPRISTIAIRRELAPGQPLHLIGSEFRVAVWRALLEIPPGQTRSYREVATGLGRPTAVRSVASAVAANRIAFLVPCHRIVPASFQTGSSSQTGLYRWGTTLKKAILEREQLG